MNEETAKEVSINSRLLGHRKHPTITDVPLGSWSVTLVADTLAILGQKQWEPAGDLSVSVGLAASLLASLGGLADMSETHEPEERRLGMIHGISQGVTMLLYGSSLVARRARNQGLGRALSLAGFGTLLVASFFANELAERKSTSMQAD